LRIAVSTESLFGESLDPLCVEAVEQAAGLCAELGHEVEPATPPVDQSRLTWAFNVIVAVGTAGAIELAGRLAGRRPTLDQFELLTWVLGQVGREVRAVDFDAAIGAARQAGRQLGQFFERYDLLCNATLGRPPWKLGVPQYSGAERAALRLLRRVPLKPLLRTIPSRSGVHWEATPNTMLFNLTGQPAMSVRLHWSRSGLPIGVQFVGRFGDEATLFRLAAQLEAARPWRDRRPPLVSADG
jgi:amidase